MVIELLVSSREDSFYHLRSLLTDSRSMYGVFLLLHGLSLSSNSFIEVGAVMQHRQRLTSLGLGGRGISEIFSGFHHRTIFDSICCDFSAQQICDA
jgi:hypothetical protein